MPSACGPSDNIRWATTRWYCSQEVTQRVAPCPPNTIPRSQRETRPDGSGSASAASTLAPAQWPLLPAEGRCQLARQRWDGVAAAAPDTYPSFLERGPQHPHGSRYPKSLGDKQRQDKVRSYGWQVSSGQHQANSIVKAPSLGEQVHGCLRCEAAS
jgi:hypothetical protein